MEGTLFLLSEFAFRPNASREDALLSRTRMDEGRGLPRAAYAWTRGNRALAAVLLAALILRLLPLLWATPLAGDCGPTRGQNLRSYHYDEDKVYRSTAAFPAIYFRPDQPYPTYGTTLQYTLGLLLLPVKIVLFNREGGRDVYLLGVWIVSRCVSV